MQVRASKVSKNDNIKTKCYIFESEMLQNPIDKGELRYNIIFFHLMWHYFVAKFVTIIKFDNERLLDVIAYEQCYVFPN